MKKIKKKPKEKISVTIDKDIYDKIQTISGASLISPSAIVNYMLRNSKRKFQKLYDKYVDEDYQEKEEVAEEE